MAISPSLRPLCRVCGVCARQQVAARRHFATSQKQRFDDVRSESRLPRVATTSFWASLIPKPFRRVGEPAPEGTTVATPTRVRKPWNPYTSFIVLAILIGSNAIQMIGLRNEMVAFSRHTEAKLELLREVVEKVKRGEINDAEVKRALGTGDPKAEAEWEEVMKEVEETDVLWEAHKRKEAKRAAKADEKKVRHSEEREGASPTAPTVTGSTGDVGQARPRFLM
jgi:hypothetical protein